MSTVLVVDDERNIRSTLSDTLALEGHDVLQAEGGEAALDLLSGRAIDLVLLDLQMPGMDGLELLRRLRRDGHELPVIFLTAHGTIEKAVEAVRLGAYDFIEKPPMSERILVAARNALRQAELEDENRELRGDAADRYDMIGDSPPMRELFEQIRRTAPTQATVLILGENGSGKELIARALHLHSPRARGPFVRVNCAAIPRELFESELFGHERGAFTGATARRKGKFARADRGTLFLDEIGETPTGLQAKLLRSLESGEIEPVGGEREVQVDVRVLAATNRDLERAVAEGSFRKDLYYRLQVVTLRAPALRERKEDIPALARHFLATSCAENNLPDRLLTDEALARLTRYGYPGNVRELRNLMERLAILAPGGEIAAADIDRHLPDAEHAAVAGELPSGPLRETMTSLERRVVLAALERNRWRMAATARELALERSHLYKKLKALGIEKPD